MVVSPASGIFRDEALEHHALGHRRRGDLLRISPAWTGWFFWLLLAVVAAGVLYVIFGTAHEYAEGVAVIMFEDRSDILAELPGTVLGIAVRPGDRVEQGQLLARLGDAEEAADLDRIKRERELQLINYLRDPADEDTRQALIALRARQELAETRQEKRAVSAPRSGVVSDIRVEIGQQIAPGQVILSLVHDDALPTVAVLLPGQYQPRLALQGQQNVAGTDESQDTESRLVLELEGYRHSHRERLKIQSVGAAIVGPGEIRRYLDDEIADSVAIKGPVVLVRAELKSREFQADDRRYEYHHGMHARARVRLGPPKSVLLRLLPWLETLTLGNDG
jgi:membrane fusion protein (multidrug efflux system)